MTTDTKAVARWDAGPGVNPRVDGKFVLFTTHERVVGEFSAERLRWFERAGEYLKRAQAAEDALVASRAEVEGLKKDAIRRLDLIRATVENSEWRHGSRNIYGELSREIQSADAEMENGNV